MNRKIIIFLLVAGLLSASGVVATSSRQVVTLSTPGVNKTLLLPEQAGNSHVISLGSAVDPQSGNVVEGLAIVHYRDNHAKGGIKGSGKDKGDSPVSSCYSFLAKGAKWKANESWVVNPLNTRGLDALFVYNSLTANIEKWEDAADGAVGDGNGVDILGNGLSTDSLLAADTASPDGMNEVYFADIASPGAIGVTVIWGYFGGRPQSRELVEWDQVYDDVDFDWSEAGEAGKMDFDNIAIHELGHSVGMGDLYELDCAEETMYGYAAEGEIKKRDLNAGDITGISKLY